MKRFDRYIFKEVMGPFTGGVLFFTFVFIMFQALRLAEFLIVHGIKLDIVIKMTWLLTMSVFPITFPIAFLVSMLVSFGRLSTDSELVAFKAAGIGLGRMAVAPFMFAGLIAVFTLLLNLEWVPWAQREFRKLHVKVGNTKVASAIKEGTFTSGFFDLLVFADRVDKKSNRLKNVFIFDEREKGNPLTVIAKSGEIFPVQTDSEFASSIVFKLHDGNIHRNEISSETYQKIDFGEYQLFLNILEGEESGKIHKPKMLSYGELESEISQRRANEKKLSGRYHDLDAEKWRRIAVGISPLIFVLLGMGLGTIRTRSVKSGAALLTVLVFGAYWGLLVAGTKLVKSFGMPASIALQLPNAIVFFVGWRFFKRAAW